jgi:cell shape-determining protein MreC
MNTLQDEHTNEIIRLCKKNEPMQKIVQRCLDSESAYRLLKKLADLAEENREEQIGYISEVTASEIYNEAEIEAMTMLIGSGIANYIMAVIDEAREEQVQREIEEMVS